MQQNSCCYKSIWEFFIEIICIDTSKVFKSLHHLVLLSGWLPAIWIRNHRYQMQLALNFVIRQNINKVKKATQLHPPLWPTNCRFHSDNTPVHVANISIQCCQIIYTARSSLTRLYPRLARWRELVSFLANARFCTWRSVLPIWI